MSHTPGPWKCVEGYKGAGPFDRIVVETQGDRSFVICSIHRQNGDYRPEDRGNFNFIAAAPDLYAALEKMTSEIEASGANGFSQTLAQAREALKKATTL